MSNPLLCTRDAECDNGRRSGEGGRGHRMEGAEDGQSLADECPQVIDGDGAWVKAVGNQDSWGAIVDRLSPLVWSLARARRLDDERVSSVFRATWMRLADHLDSLPSSMVGAWLEHTTERECARIIALADTGTP
jgi:hypothetical protein